MSPDIKAPGLDEARAALARVDAACAEYGWTTDDGMSSDHLRSALTVADRLAADLLDARAQVATLTAERDAYKRAKAENDERFMLERDEARSERDTALARIAALEAEAARLAPAAMVATPECGICGGEHATTDHRYTYADLTRDDGDF